MSCFSCVETLQVTFSEDLSPDNSAFASVVKEQYVFLSPEYTLISLSVKGKSVPNTVPFTVNSETNLDKSMAMQSSMEDLPDPLMPTNTAVFEEEGNVILAS